MSFTVIVKQQLEEEMLKNIGETVKKEVNESLVKVSETIFMRYKQQFMKQKFKHQNSSCRIFFKCFSYLYEVVRSAHNLFRRFLDFSQFWTAISRKLWRHLATNVRTM